MFRLDHLIIAVRDLETARVNYQKLGFTVLPGGTHANGATHNALVVFADGSYLELLALTGNPPQNDTADYSFLLKMGEGFVGYALQSDNLVADIAGMQARGLTIQPITEGGRQRPDGTPLRWQTAIFADGSMSPFFIQDVTPRNLRVPDTPAAVTHANGVVGIGEIIFYVADLAATVARYAAITGTIPQQRASGALFLLADSVLTLHTFAPQRLYDDILYTGEMPARAVLYSAGGELPVLPPTDSTQTHGAQYEFITQTRFKTALQ